jgi:hypothetical protein
MPTRTTRWDELARREIQIALKISEGNRLNLRRTGWGAVRQAKRCQENRESWISFAFPADTAVPRIFQDYTTFRQLFAEAIGGGEVA